MASKKFVQSLAEKMVSSGMKISVKIVSKVEVITSGMPQTRNCCHTT